MATTSAIVYSPDGLAPPDVVERWLAALGLPILRIRDAETLMSGALRARPRVVVFDSRSLGDDARAALHAPQERFVHRRRSRRRDLLRTTRRLSTRAFVPVPTKSFAIRSM